MKFTIFILTKFLSKIVPHIKHPLKLRIKSNDLIHKITFLYLEPYFHKSKNIISKKIYTCLNNSGIIWMFWWQGRSKMPLIVKRCIHSVMTHSNGHRVILISKDNIHSYARIPKYIYIKLRNGNITLTHFSDILRFNLLKIYGGLWIDSTIYCIRDINDTYFGEFYTSGPGGININRNHDFISNKWTGFLIGGCKHSPIFNFMDTFFRLYWKKNNYLINYFLIDYGLYYIYLYNIGKFHKYVNNIAFNHNPCLHSLMNHLNDKFDLDYYRHIAKDTDMFKLTYKINFNDLNDSFYDRLITHKL